MQASGSPGSSRAGIPATVPNAEVSPGRISTPWANTLSKALMPSSSGPGPLRPACSTRSGSSPKTPSSPAISALKHRDNRLWPDLRSRDPAAAPPVAPPLPTSASSRSASTASCAGRSTVPARSCERVGPVHAIPWRHRREHAAMLERVQRQHRVRSLRHRCPSHDPGRRARQRRVVARPLGLGRPHGVAVDVSARRRRGEGREVARQHPATSGLDPYQLGVTRRKAPLDPGQRLRQRDHSQPRPHRSETSCIAAEHMRVPAEERPRKLPWRIAAAATSCRYRVPPTSPTVSCVPSTCRQWTIADRSSANWGGPCSPGCGRCSAPPATSSCFPPAAPARGRRRSPIRSRRATAC